MNIAVDGDTAFRLGWLACYLGLPCRHPHASALRAEDVRAFADGWKDCSEMDDEGRAGRFAIMHDAGQAVVYWQDDDGNEIETR